MGNEIVALRKAIDELEVRTLLSGEYDSREALVAIRAGAGGVDAADFAEMLLRMYLRWAERHGYPTEVYDTSYAEEAGLKSATFAVKAPYAYGTLSVESGTHRLVRISPFDNQGRRQTSFAGVEVVPVVEQTDDIDIPDERAPGRRLPLVGPGWTERQHHRLGGAAHPPADRHRGDLPEREVPAAEQGVRDAACSRPGCSSASGRRRQAKMDGLKQRRRRLVGRPDALVRAAPVPDGQGSAHRARDGQPVGGLRRRHRPVHRGRHPVAQAAGS